MKMPVLLILTCFFASMAVAIATPTSPVFQIRLAQVTPMVDSERMTYVSRYQYNTYTNVLYVQKIVLLDQTAIKSARVRMDSFGQPIIDINFTDAGAKRFAEVTQQNVHKRLAIVIDGQLCEAAIIAEPILGGRVSIAGSFSKQEAADLVQKINAALTAD